MNCLKIDNGDEKEEEEVEEKAEEENEITKGNRGILRCPTVSPYGDTVGHQSVWQNFGAEDVKCFVFPSSCVFLCYISSPFLTSFTDQMLVLCSTVPPFPPPSFKLLFCSICCIVQYGFLLQETSSRKSQSASLPPREMFSAIQNNSSTPPRNSTLANFTGLFNRRCLVNSLRNSGKYFFSLTSLGCSVANEVTRKRARSETKILCTEFGYVKL